MLDLFDFISDILIRSVFLFHFFFFFSLSFSLSLTIQNLDLKKFWGRRVVKIQEWLSLAIPNQAFRLEFKIFTARLGLPVRMIFNISLSTGIFWVKPLVTVDMNRDTLNKIAIALTKNLDKSKSMSLNWIKSLNLFFFGLLYCMSKRSWPNLYIVTYDNEWAKTSWTYSSMIRPAHF